MKLLTDSLSIILFFIVYKFFGIYWATGVAVGTGILILAFYYFTHRTIELMQWCSLLLIILMGGATLILHNELFIKWKPTVIEWLFAGILLINHYSGKELFLKKTLGQNFSLPDPIWKKLNLSWITFFLIMGLLNIFILYHFSTNAWVNFKLFGLLGGTIIFVLWQTVFIGKHLKN